MSNNIRAAVFDLDGTLLRTEHLHWRAWDAVLRPHGFHLTKAAYQSYCGHTGTYVENGIRSFFHLENKVKRGQLLAAKDRIIHRHLSTQPLHWMLGARLALDFFKTRQIPIAVATGANRAEMELKLKRLGARAHFDHVICLDDVERGKPHPDIYLEACRQLHVRPRDAIAFEDTAIGLQSAHSAGLRVIAIPTPYSKNQDFKSAWRVCHNFKQAIRIIKG